MLRTIFIFFLALTLHGHAFARPNIVFILADDLGIGDTKVYGGDRCLIHTPNIDRLAAGGLRFTDAHPSASVCGPTRLAIMTGRYPWRNQQHDRGGAWGFTGLKIDPAKRHTLGDMFREAGYKTGYVGKWHLGTLMTTNDGEVQGETNVDYTKPLKVGPPEFGFDYSFILPGSLDMYPYAYAKNNVWQGEITAQKGWSAFNRVGDAEKDFEDHEVLETFFDEADAYIGRQKQNDRFFLFLALTAPHTPTSPGINWQGKSKLGVYGDFVMEVDHAVERVVNTLKKQGLYEDTLILFSSDHGPASYAGNILPATYGQIHLMEKSGHYPGGPHRGYKFSVYEGGLRVPLIAHWPAVIKPGNTSDALVGLNDLMATFAEITEHKLNPKHAPDSISFAKVLRNHKAGTQREHLVMQSAMEVFVIRDGEWKLCLGPGSGAKGLWGNVPLPEDAWKVALEKHKESPSLEAFLNAPFVQLFNLSNDPHEDNNLAQQHPDRVKAMVKQLQKQIDEGRSTPGPKLANDKKINIHQRLPEFVQAQLK
ncbi:MAG: arylsulfatase [Verrucomicrobia bacterium]|nr:arylsulfatase [Verrucomicrobiota bacterium]MDA1068265.1 arylsulfatase [Verrucomicrobiota bacterium]